DGNLARCAPGGKATSRMIKQLLGEIGAPAPLPAVAAPSLPPQRAPREHFAARLRAAEQLTRGAQKDTRLVTLDCDIAADSYEVGDSLGVVARNCPELVGAI